MILTTIRIERHLAADRGRYVARIDHVEGEAELTFTRRSPALISADHTSAPPSMRGTGVALALVERLIADARAEAFKVMPLCSYVRTQFDRHPEWADVLHAN